MSENNLGGLVRTFGQAEIVDVQIFDQGAIVTLRQRGNATYASHPPRPVPDKVWREIFRCENGELRKVALGSSLPGDAGTWSIGDPNNPSRDDAMSGSEEAASNNAAAISRDSERVTAVWHGSECVALYLDGRAYRPC